MPSPVCFPSGSAGLPNCSRATSPTRCFVTSVRSTPTRAGSARSPPCSTHRLCSSPAFEDTKPARRSSPSPWLVTPWSIWRRSSPSSRNRTSPIDLPRERYEQLYQLLCQSGVSVCRDGESYERLRDLRALYEGYAAALSEHLCMPLPPWMAEHRHKDNWLAVAKVRKPGRSR